MYKYGSGEREHIIMFCGVSLGWEVSLYNKHLFFMKITEVRYKYALWTGAIGAHLVGRCILYSYRLLSRLSDLMNRNMKQMKLEATRLTEAQQCEIIANLSKQNASSKHAMGWETEINAMGWDGTIRRTYYNENPTYRRHLPNVKVLPTSKALKLHTSLSSTLTMNC